MEDCNCCMVDLVKSGVSEQLVTPDALTLSGRFEKIKNRYEA